MNQDIQHVRNVISKADIVCGCGRLLEINVGVTKKGYACKSWCDDCDLEYDEYSYNDMTIEDTLKQFQADVIDRYHYTYGEDG